MATAFGRPPDEAEAPVGNPPRFVPRGQPILWGIGGNAEVSSVAPAPGKLSFLERDLRCCKAVRQPPSAGRPQRFAGGTGQENSWLRLRRRVAVGPAGGLTADKVARRVGRGAIFLTRF